MIKVKDLPKVFRDRMIKQPYSAIAKTLNISASTTGTIICRWKVHITTSNNSCTGVA